MTAHFKGHKKTTQMVGLNLFSAPQSRIVNMDLNLEQWLAKLWFLSYYKNCNI